MHTMVNPCYYALMFCSGVQFHVSSASFQCAHQPHPLLALCAHSFPHPPPLTRTENPFGAKVHARLRDTLYGTAVIELMAVQDLFMAPLLAIPTALSHIVWQQTPLQLLATLGRYGVGLAAVCVLTSRASPAPQALERPLNARRAR